MYYSRRRLYCVIQFAWRFQFWKRRKMSKDLPTDLILGPGTTLTFRPLEVLNPKKDENVPIHSLYSTPVMSFNVFNFWRFLSDMFYLVDMQISFETIKRMNEVHNCFKSLDRTYVKVKHESRYRILFSISLEISNLFWCD